MADQKDQLEYVSLCAVGDSIVAGLGDSTGLGWTGRVAERARHHGMELHVSVLGIPGDTSTMVLDRWVEVDRRLTRWPDLAVVVGLGSNDAVEVDGRPRVTPEGTEAAVRSIADRAPAGRLLLVGPPPMEWEAVNARVAERSDLLDRTCEDLGVLYLPTFDALAVDPVWRREVAARDGAHPDAGGYAALAELVTPGILAWLSPS